ncbi:hypothetical protein WJX79_006288 [Trebouxia sp. C0005]
MQGKYTQIEFHPRLNRVGSQKRGTCCASRRKPTSHVQALYPPSVEYPTTHSMKTKAKKAADTPAAIKSFLDKVLSTPEDQLADVLEAFTWKADKGDFHHWVPLFNFFDAYFEKHVQSRPDLQLKSESAKTEGELPSRTVIAVLKVTGSILENCSNKHLYSSCEHLTTLLAASDQGVVTATLQAFVALVRKTHIASIRYPGGPEQNARLLALAQGWGGKEQGLGLVECAHEDESAVNEGLSLATRLHFDFYSEAKQDNGEVSGLKTIDIQRLDKRQANEYELLSQLVSEYQVPEALRFTLLTKIRTAKGFGSLQGRRYLVRTRLLAFYVWFQSQPGHDETAAFFQKEGEIVSELVALLQAESAVPEDLRTLALRALAVQLLDRTRHTPVISAISSDAGVVPALLPLVRDTDPDHVNLVSAGVRILEAFMDFNAAAATVFRDLGGLQAMIHRLETEIVIERGQEFGGALFALAASVMSDLIHHDPLCFGTLEKAGLPEAYLKAIQAGVLPSGEAVCSLPNTLVALCLNNAGMERVRQTKALGCFVSIFTSKAYIKALQGDTPPALGAGLDELLRHVSSLRKEGVEMIVDILKRLCEMGGLPVPVSDDPMDTDVTPASETPATTEASAPPPPEPNQDVEMTGEEQAATSTAAAAKQPPIKKAPIDPDAASYLPECITHTARLLESMFSNHDTCSKFVQQGGVEVLLQLYRLPKLPPTFGSSSASHSLLAMFRSLTAHNSSDISSKLQPSLSSQFTITLQLAEVLDDRVVPELPAAERDLYIRQVSGTVGLAALAATVVRVAPALLLSLCSTEENIFGSILSQLGRLERRVLWQLAQAENWKRDQDAAKEAAKGGPTPEAESSFGAPSADAAEMSTGRDVAMAGTAPADAELLDDADTETAAAAADREAAASPTSKGRKKTPEELSVEVLLHFVGTVRAFYASVAKAVHAQARRRDDPAFQPNASMKAASLTLGLILKDNLTATHQGAEDDKGKGKGPLYHQGQPEAMRYLQRVVDEVLAVLFDSRRQSCHGLVLNNFVSCSGFRQLLAQFQVACQVLFDAVDMQEAQPEADPAAGKAKGMPDSDLVITKPDPADNAKQAAEKLVWSFLVLFENLVSARTLLKSLQEATLLVTPALGQPALAKGTETSIAEAFVKKLQATVTKAVLPLWSYHKLPKCSFRITRQTIVDMGFSRARVEDTLRRFGNSSAELAIEWLMTHPEEPGAADAGATDTASKDEDEAVKKQLIASLGTDEVPKLEAMLDESAEAPSIQQLVDGSVATVAQMPAAAFPLADMLVSLCSQEAGKNKQQVFGGLVQHIKRLAAAQDTGVQECPEVLLAPAHLLAILLTEDKARGSPTAFVGNADQEGLFDAVVQVLARVTKSHKVALKVLAARGPRLILEMPGACFLPEHEPYVSAIFRHILEDPVTLQAAMEAEIRNTLSARGGSSAAMPVRQFLSTISPVIAREPAVFVEAMANTCNVEESRDAMGTGRPIVLLKPKSDDKASSHKDKPSGTASAPEGPSIPASTNPSAPPSAASTATPRNTGLTRQGSGRAGGTPKAKDTPKTASKGAAKGSKKTVPASFVEVIDCLVDVTLRYKGMQPGEEADLADPVSEAMETDEPFTISAQLPDGRMVRVSATQSGRGAGSAAGQQPGASQTAGQAGPSKAPAKASFTEQAMNPKRREVLVQCLTLKMLTDFTLMYSSCVGVLLKRDGEIAAKESGMKTPGKGTQTGAGALFKHVMHAHLTHLSEPSTTLQGLTEQAAFFLLSICIRSAEGRRRIVSEIAHTLNPSDRSEQRPEDLSIVRCAASNPYRAQPGFPAPHKVKAFVELVSSLLSASITNPSSQDGASPPGLAGEMLRVMKEAGVLKGLTNALKLVDTDHPQAGKSITGILKPLEILTRPQLPRSKPSAGATTAAAAASTAHQAAAASTQGAGSAAGVGEAAAGGSGSQTVQHSTAPAEASRGADASMEDAEESAAGPEAMAAAEAAREAGMRARNQGRRNFNPRTMEALVEDMIEQAYAGDGLEGFNSDSEDNQSDDEGDHVEGMSGDEQMGEQEDFEGSDGFDEDDEHDSEGDEDDDEDDDDEEDDDEDDDMSEEDSEPFSDSEGSEGVDEDAEAVDVVLDHDDDDMSPDANGAVVINMGGHHPEDGMGEADNDDGEEDDEEDEDDDEEDEDEEEDEAYDEDGSDMGAHMPGEEEEADWDLLLNEEDDGVVHWDAVGDLLGNMGGAGMRNMNADRRRHRIMQSRGTRALGEGPQAAAAIASGPAAQSAQHRLLQRPTSLSGAAAQAGLAAGRADAAGALMEGMPAGLRRIAGQAAQLLTSHPGLAFPDNIRSLFGAIPGGAMARGGGIGPLPGGFQTAAEMGQTHAQAGTRAGGWAEGVGSNATAVSSLAGALERQLLDVLQQPRAAAAAAAGEGPQQQADPAAQGADHDQAQPDTAEAQRDEQLQARHQELQGSDARANRITSAMFGSAMQAAMAAAQQGQGAASSSQPPQHPTPASEPPAPVPAGDQDMAEADDADEPAPPADIQIGPLSSTPAGDADTAMDEEPAAPIDVPMGSLDTAAAMDTEADPGSGLGEQLVQAAQDAGIDLAFLEALPEELRAEVLAAHGVTLPPPAPPAAAPAAAAVPEAAAAPAAQPAEGAAAAATPSEGEAAAPAAEAAAGPSADTAAAAAAAAAPAPEDEGDSIDPEFLAALPPEIQAEVLEQQRRERRMRERQRQQQQAAAAAAAQGGGAAGAGAAAGAGSEMDLATILATFPPDVREEVLLTSEEDVINSLPPALLAEAQQLRQRVMQHYRDNHASAGGRGVVFVGGPNSYARRGGTAGGRGAGAPGSGPGSSAYNLLRLQSEGAAALGTTDRAVEGPPQIEEEAVLLLTGLLKLAEAPARAQLQRVLLNLCAHPESRKQVMQILMSMLRAPLSADEAAEASQRDTQMDESEASTSQCLVPSPVRPGQEVLPHVSRRVLEYANHLARNRSEVARDMLRLRVPTPDQLARHTAALQDKKGKGRPMDWATEVSHEERALEVLIGMTAKTLCRRSNSHLEQALLLVESGLSELAQKRCASVIRMLVDTCPQLKPLMLSELQNELQRLSKLAGEELSELQARNFSSAGDISAHASGVRVLVLRVLKAAVSLTKAKGGKQDQAKEQVDEQDSAITAEMSQRLEPLWAALSATITQIEANLPAHTDTSSEAPSAAASILPPGAAQVLPLVEAFFVMCDARTLPQTQPSSPLQSAMSAEFPLGATPGPSTMEPALQQTPSSRQHAHGGASAPSQPIAEPHVPFLRFAEKHRRLLNTLLRQNASLLQGSLQPLLKVPRLIEFDNKRSYFRARIHSSGDDHRRYGGLRLAVRRSHVFEDSFHQMRMRSPDEMRMKLSVQFQGEEGIDAGGVSREWYQVMAREIFNPNFSLFVQVPEHGTTFQPNANSVVQNDEARGTNHLDFFKFVGRILGKALYDGQLIDAFFTRSFYKHMLGDPLTYEDIEAVDPEYYKNLRWMLENNITDVLDLTFTEESDYFGKKELVELKPGGKDMRVTEENKREYVNLVARHRMTTAIKPQINSFLEGFWDLVPKDLINMFNDHELELLISGLPEIDVDDLRANTEYTGYTPAAKQIQWFWELVSALSKEDLALLVQFVTGTSKVPLEGFKALQGISGPQKFQIHKSYGPQDRLPSAHTCFNQLDILEYESKEQLSNRLMVAIHEGSEGFGFG